MKAKLIETVHETWAPAGTEGNAWMDNSGLWLFMPDKPVEDFPWPGGLYFNPRCAQIEGIDSPEDMFELEKNHWQMMRGLS